MIKPYAIKIHDITMTVPLRFRDVHFEKKDGNLFEVTTSLVFWDRHGNNKTLIGKSTRSLINTETAEFARGQTYMEMKNEARRAALSDYFKEYYGHTDISDITVDEFGRPINDKTRMHKN